MTTRYGKNMKDNYNGKISLRDKPHPLSRLLATFTKRDGIKVLNAGGTYSFVEVDINGVKQRGYAEAAALKTTPEVEKVDDERNKQPRPHQENGPRINQD